MDKDFILALDELEKTKKIPREVVFDALEKALIKSYEKNFNTQDKNIDEKDLEVNINQDTGEIKLYVLKTVVESMNEPATEISIEEAKKIRSTTSIDDVLKIEITPKNFGRIAAQTARNIVIQKIKDAERDVIFNEFIEREKEIITGTIQRIDRNNLYIDLGRVEGVVPIPEQIKTETYHVNQRLKLFIKEVKNTPKGAQIILSRTDNNLVRRMLELEIPEIHDGTVEIYSIAREAGSRTKLAVYTNDPDVDPVGACIGFKGTRVKSIVDELNGEKLDIIIYDKDSQKFISNSLSPAEVLAVFVDEKKKTCRAIVAEEQLSLAIGKEGQNARLAAKLTNWKIDIKGINKYLDSIKDRTLFVEYEDEVNFLKDLQIDVENIIVPKTDDIDEVSDTDIIEDITDSGVDHALFEKSVDKDSNNEG